VRETDRDHTTVDRSPSGRGGLMADPGASPFARTVVPVAGPEDAATTATAALPRIAAAGGRALVVYVVEKAGGAPDKASVEQREAVAEEAFDAVRDRASAADLDVEIETAIRYGTDVAETIQTAAAEADATAIVFVPRAGSAWADLLTGGVRRDLVTDSDVPVIVLPDPDEGDENENDDDDGDGGEPA
jgi:nucleotide-binding universal stress UspA family protein